jgi:hypothetical protein
VARPTLEVADIFRRYGETYRAATGPALSTAQRRVMTAIEWCRTARLGGHVEQCEACGHQRIAYNSCVMGSPRFWGAPLLSASLLSVHRAHQSP